MATILLCHGAWSAAWAWRKLRSLMVAAGHDFHAPSYTGLGERAHLSHPGLTLSDHVADIQGILRAEEMSDVVLLGHSYGGMVATAVAALAPGRVARVIYLDAFVPRSGQSLFDLIPAKQSARMITEAAKDGAGLRVPPNPPPPDTSAEDSVWIARQRQPMPVGCFSEKLWMETEPTCPRHYIYCTRTAPGDIFGQFAERARSEPGWSCDDLDASHSPAVTAPDALMAMVNRLIGPA